MFRFNYFVVLFIFIIMSCSTSRVGQKPDTGSEESKRRRGKYVETFDPLSLNDDDLVVPVSDANRRSDGVPEPVPVIIPTDSARSSEEMVSGYRVQLFATRNEAEAREAKKKAILKFEERVSLDFEAPYYKLRIGDCQDRKEAESLKDKAIRLGFRNPEPWVIKSKVYSNKGGT